MVDHVRLPIKDFGGAKWAELGALGTHEICGEQCHLADSKFSFIGGHRVRLFKFKKNVHWKLPTGVELDISGVTPADPARRRQAR